MPLEIEGTVYYTTAEAAAELGISPVTVRQAVANGALTTIAINARLNMVSAESLEEYRQAHLGRKGRPKGSKNRAKGQTGESDGNEA